MRKQKPDALLRAVEKHNRRRRLWDKWNNANYAQAILPYAPLISVIVASIGIFFTLIAVTATISTQTESVNYNAATPNIALCLNWANFVRSHPTMTDDELDGLGVVVAASERHRGIRSSLPRVCGSAKLLRSRTELEAAKKDVKNYFPREG